jgi:hypothetical protein
VKRSTEGRIVGDCFQSDWMISENGFIEVNETQFCT